MDFIGLPLPSDHIEAQRLGKLLGPTKGFKVAIIDSSYESNALSNDYIAFNNLPVCHSIHNCEVETKLSSHGFLCASILAGKHKNADFYGICEGTIRGVVPDAQLYIYAVGCKNCARSPKTLVSAIDLAIKDNVRVISMSQGMTNIVFDNLDNNWTAEISKSTLRAFEKNILVCVPAGNDGPAPKSLLYGMPWCVNVGACTIGKNLVTNVTIGTKGKVPSNVKILGTTVDENFEEIRILDKLEGISMNIIESRFLLLRISKTLARDREGILYASEYAISLKSATLGDRNQLYMLNIPKCPTVTISRDNCEKIRQWFYTIEKLYLCISTSSCQEDKRMTYVPEFSGRGPSRFYPEIVMPDFVAPGCNILASHSENIPFATIMKREGNSYEGQRICNSQRMMTGTSLATPHVAGLFATLLSNRPEWSISMAKSAAITSAWSFADNGIRGNEFMFGAGLMQLEQALNPVLVYDESHSNFESYLNRDLAVDNLNIASFAGSFTQSHEYCERVFKRVLTNITEGEVTYEAEIKFFDKSLDKDATIQVLPDCLSFNPREKKSFALKASVCPSPLGHISALLIWKQKGTNHRITSPIHLYHRSAFDVPLWYDRKVDQESSRQVPEAKKGMSKGKEKITRDDGDKGKGKLSDERIIGQKRPR